MIETREIKAAATAWQEDLVSPRQCLQPAPSAQGTLQAQLLLVLRTQSPLKGEKSPGHIH